MASLPGSWRTPSLLHLSPTETRIALREIHRVLASSGLLHVSVKRGVGAEWETDRYGEPRWFQYWSEAELDEALRSIGFRVDGAWVNETPRAVWLVRLASRVG